MHNRPRVPTASLTRVALSSGRTVDLAELHLTPTYGTLLDAYPCRPVNDLRIKTLLHTAERMSPTTPVHLIPPPREYPDHYAGPHGPVEFLPLVACTARLSSPPLNPTNDPLLYHSTLTVLWFQPTPHIPNPHDTTEALRDLDWAGLARDHEVCP
ncbi:hypothetical protein ACWEDZ_01270 [Streptomyces sp. NPDC005047]|uniref:hypothetical protein n=2 Tax=Streptomyces TaxID=1883 RepID=UPI00340A46F0